LAGMLEAYYQLRGWDKNGVPTEETLRDLELTAS
jgi:aldehyde:ferredoxin oxidoreductase